MSQPKITLKTPAQWLASGFGAGCSPIMPGTVGTLMAIPLWLLLSYLTLPIYLLMILLLAIAGIFICQRATDELGVHDHGGIVWDEFVGFWITMTFAERHWAHILLGFLLFRFFDILKPWPIRLADQKVSGGFGIMLDDIIAGLFALIAWLIITQILSTFLP